MEHREKAEELREQYRGFYEWRNNVQTEMNERSARIKVASEALAQAYKQWALTPDGELARSRIVRAQEIGKRVREMRKIEAKMYAEIRTAFSSPVRSQTVEVLDPGKDDVVSVGSVRATKVTVGKAGFGIRQNVVSRPVTADSEVRYILRNSKEIRKNLEKQNCVKAAGMLRDIVQAVPSLAAISDEGVTVLLQRPVEIAGNQGVVMTAKAVEFGANWNPVSLHTDKQSCSATPERGTLAFAAYLAVEPQIDGLLARAERILEENKVTEDSVEALRKVIGRWLLLSSL